MPVTKQGLSRLLNIYPVDLLKAEFDVQGRRKEDVIETIIKKASEQEVLKFSKGNQDVTRQHVFIFENKPQTLRGFPKPALSDYVPVFTKYERERIEEFYAIEVEYTVVVGPPYRDLTLKFLWPVSVLAETQYTRVTFTILEKNVDAYLGTNERAINTKRNLDEESILSVLISSLPDTLALARADINKGVKKLWADDKIDSVASRWKEARLTMTSTMDKKYLLKRDEPEKYKDAIKAPLLKTLFVALTKDDFPAQFAVEPSEGELMLNRFVNTGEVENVVRAILAAN